MLIKRQDGEQVSKGGIIIPDAHREKSHRCDVIAVGPGRYTRDGQKRIEMTVKPGDVCIVGGWEGAEVKIAGVPHLVIENEGILAVEEPAA